METKRLFIGTFADTSLFEFVYPELMERFGKICSGKWVELHNLHFTYKFLGDVETGRIEEIHESLAPLLKDYDYTLDFSGLGVFPNKSRPKVLFINIHDQASILKVIHEQIEKNMMKLGFDPEKRNFHPHLTLVRLKSVKYPDFKKELDSIRNTGFGIMTGFRTVLVESVLTNKGPIYKPFD